MNIKGGVESAEAIALRYSSDVSKLAGIAYNVELAMESVYRWISKFMAVSYEPDITMNKVFYQSGIDSQVLSALINAELSQSVPPGTVFRYLVEGELLQSDDIEKQIEEFVSGPTDTSRIT